MKLLVLIAFSIINVALFGQDKITDYTVKDIQSIRFFYKNENKEKIGSLQDLKDWLASQKKQTLVFATNGAMFTPEYAPVGLYIENYKEIKGLNRSKGGSNFSTKPNGVFLITESNKARIVTTESFKNNGKIKYATQSGPMLVIDGNIHPAFAQNSPNLNVRNGVGILPDGSVLFAISNEAVNFYEFAAYFKQKGCKNALYIDGAISEIYCPEKKLPQTRQPFGVMIGVVK